MIILYTLGALFLLVEMAVLLTERKGNKDHIEFYHNEKENNEYNLRVAQSKGFETAEQWIATFSK